MVCGLVLQTGVQTGVSDLKPVYSISEQDWSVDWSVDWCVDQFVDWSIDWSVGWSKDWCMDWCIDLSEGKETAT